MKKEEKIIQGRKNRMKGLAFERKVREDLEKKGWIVSKYQNNLEFPEILLASVDQPSALCVPAKMGRFRTNQNGFPDFICYKYFGDLGKDLYQIIFVEVKMKGYMKPEEKKKALWYLENNYCLDFFVASLLNKEINYKQIERLSKQVESHSKEVERGAK